MLKGVGAMRKRPSPQSATESSTIQAARISSGRACGSSRRNFFSTILAPLAAGMQDDARQHNHPGKEILPFLAESQEQQQGLHDRDDHRPGNGAQDRTLPASDGGAPYENCGDPVLVIAEAEVHVAQVVADGKQDARQPGENARPKIGAGNAPPGLQPRGLGGPGGA